MHRTLLIVAALLAATGACAQQVYKWTDAQGTVHYSQTAPASGTKYRTMTATGTVAPLTPAVSTSAPAVSDPTATTTTMAAGSPNQAMCAALSKNLAALRGTQPVIMMQNGKQVVADAGQRKEQLNNAQSQYQQYCNPEAK